MISLRGSAEPPHTPRRIGAVVAVLLVAFGALVAGLVGAAPVGADPDPTAAPTVPATTAAPPEPPPSSAAPSISPTAPPETAPPDTERGQSDTQYQGSGQASNEWNQSSGSVVENRRASSDDASSQSTTPSMTTTEDLLVGTPTTRPPTTTIAPRDLTGSSVTRTGGSSDPKIWAVVAGLAVVGVGLGVATIVYWRRTRPVAGSPDDDTDRSKRSRGRSRFADLVVTSPEPP